MLWATSRPSGQDQASTQEVLLLAALTAILNSHELDEILAPRPPAPAT
jgi:hypothetical protein